MGSSLLSGKKSRVKNSQEFSTSPWVVGRFSVDPRLNDKFVKDFKLLLEGPDIAKEKGMAHFRNFQTALFKYYMILADLGVRVGYHLELLNKTQQKELKNLLKPKSENLSQESTFQPVMIMTPKLEEIPIEQIDMVFIPNVNATVPLEYNGASVDNVTGTSTLSVSNLSNVGGLIDQRLRNYNLSLKDLNNLSDEDIKSKFTKNGVPENITNATLGYLHARRKLFRKMFGGYYGDLLLQHALTDRLVLIGGLTSNEILPRAVAGLRYALVKTKNGRIYLTAITTKQFNKLKEFNASAQVEGRIKITSNAKLFARVYVSYTSSESAGVHSVGGEVGVNVHLNNWNLSPFVGIDVINLPGGNVNALRGGISIGRSITLFGYPTNFTIKGETINVDGKSQLRGGIQFTIKY